MRQSEVESLLTDEGRELLGSLLQASVDQRGDGNVGEFVIGGDGEVRSHKRVSERQLKTLFGTRKLKRFGSSSRNVGSRFPKDGQLNLPKESYSHILHQAKIV